MVGKIFSYCAIQIYQNKGSISSHLSRKNVITICNIRTIFGRKKWRVTNQRVLLLCLYFKKTKNEQVLDTEFNAESFGTSFKSQK